MRTNRTTLAPVLLVLTILGPRLGAQMPGAPVLQNAFGNPGFTAAADIGTGDGTVYAAAASWGPGSGRFQLSGGIGALNRSGGTATAWGARLAASVLSGASFGVGAFAGVGGAGSTGVDDTLRAVTEIPVGVSLGYRRMLGASHGFSIYAAPMYMHAAGESGRGSESLFRASAGVDLGITRSLGATVGAEFGSTATRAGPAGTLWGFALSYAFGR